MNEREILKYILIQINDKKKKIRGRWGPGDVPEIPAGELRIIEESLQYIYKRIDELNREEFPDVKRTQLGSLGDEKFGR